MRTTPHNYSTQLKNLPLSNACKFTPAGGKLSITTKLVLPNRQLSHRTDSETLTNTEYSKDAKDDTTHDLEAKIPTPSEYPLFSLSRRC